MNWKASAGSEVVLPEVAAPAADSLTETSAGGAEGDWLCAWCLNRVANERDRFSYGGKDEFTFSNPDGLRFEIITFLEALRCLETGKPTLEYTWFAGHAWSYCQCDRCGQHLGWYYTGQHDFVGLIKARLVRGIHARN